MIKLLNHACILSSSHILHFHRTQPVKFLHHEKNRVTHWWDLNDPFYSELSELCAHNRKVNMNQFSPRFPNKVQGVNTADVLMIRCVNVSICSYVFHPTQMLWAIDWMCFSGDLFGISVSSHVCQSVHSCPSFSLITAAICVSLCYRWKIK